MIFLSASRCFSTNSMSFIRSSEEMMERSRMGSTSPNEVRRRSEETWRSALKEREGDEILTIGDRKWK